VSEEEDKRGTHMRKKHREMMKYDKYGAMGDLEIKRRKKKLMVCFSK
jgi:hypothetical protein